MKRMLSALAAIGMIAGLLIVFPIQVHAGGYERIAAPCRTCNNGQQCLPLGMWNAAPWMTPTFPNVCQPLFAAGALLDPEPPIPITVIRLQPIPSGKPKEQPPQRPITDEPMRPKRPRIEIDEPRPGDTMPGDATNLSKLHIVLLVDNAAPDSGKAHVAGAELILQLFKNGVRAERLGAVVRLDTPDLNPDTINRKLQDVPVKPDDTLLVYYSGAAVYDDGAATISLTPSAGMAKMPREDLKKLATGRGARLTVLLTDPATKPLVAEPARKVETPDPGPAGLEKLFFGTQGILDLHACSAGEFAAARGNYGGCFTQAFVREFGRPAGTWADMLESVKFSTNNLYKSYRLEVLKSDDVAAPAKTTYRNQESQIPSQMTPADNMKPAAPPAGGGTPPKTNKTPDVGAAILENNDNKAPARIFLKVPEHAIVLIDGQPTTQTGVERGYETPPLPTNVAQSYDVRLEVRGWAGVYRVDVRGGATAMVELQVPPTVVAGK